MNQFVPLTANLALPEFIASVDDRAQRRFLEFFAVTIRNPHTRQAFARAVGELFGRVTSRILYRACRHGDAAAFPETRADARCYALGERHRLQRRRLLARMDVEHGYPT